MTKNYVELKKSSSRIKLNSYFKITNTDNYSIKDLKEIHPYILKYENSKKALEELLKEFEINKEDSLEDEINKVKEFLEELKKNNVENFIKTIKDLPKYKEIEEMEEGTKNEVVEFDLYNSKEVKEQKRKDIKELNNLANKIKDFNKGMEVTVEQQKVFNTIENMNQNDNIKIEEKSEPINQNIPKKTKKKKCLIM